MPKISPTPNFKLIGHRGVAGLRPENTLCSFAYAAELGLNWVEFDAQLTKDGQWVVIHDSTVDRTTNGQGKVNEFSLTEISQLEAGLWFNPKFPDLHIPSLHATMILCNELGLQANIEVKGSDEDPEKYAKLMANWLTQSSTNLPKPLLSSFNLECIVFLRKFLPDYPIAYLVDSFAIDTVEIALKNKFNSINCDVKTITVGNLDQATKHDIPMMLYTINDYVLAQQWLKQGIAAIFTDRADLLHKG